MLRYIKSGAAEFEIDGLRYPVGAGQIVHIPQGCELRCRAAGREVCFISVRFTAAVPLGRVDILSDSLGIGVVTPCDDPDIPFYFSRMVEARKSGDRGTLFRLKGYLVLIVAWLADRGAGGSWGAGMAPGAAAPAEPGLPPPAREEHPAGRQVLKLDSRVQAVVEYLTLHPAEHPDIDRLCAMTEMSPSSLRRLFKAHTGKSPNDFLNEMRMMAAARILLNTDDRISTIAYTLGFSDPNYFIRRFRGNFGMSPQRYRTVSRE